MAFTYSRSDIKARVNANIHGKIGLLVNANATVDDAVRAVGARLDLQSRRRSAALTPNLFNGIFDYACPSDLDTMKIIDIPAQAKREDGLFYLVPSEEFDRKHPKGAIAVDEYNNTKILKINSSVESKKITIAELDSLTSGGGTWGALDAGSESVVADNDDYVSGNGSIKFSLSAASSTTAGIVNSTMNQFDITEYLNGAGAIFAYARINSATNLTNYILRIGTDSSNYYSKTVTARHDGTALVAGWNLLRFDLSSLTETGSVTDTNITYMALYMTKTTGKVSESDYKFDGLFLMKGKYHNVKYYTKYGWISAAGSYKENSTLDTDLLVADTDEYNLIILKASELAADEAADSETSVKYATKFEQAAREYTLSHPSEAKVMSNEYHSY